MLESAGFLMRCSSPFFSSSIGKKILVASAGLILCGFLVTHLAGNLLILMGEETYNHYSQILEENPFLIPAEIILASIFLLHILVSLALKYQNRQARPVPYVMKESKGGSTWGSRTMVYTGIFVLAFLVVHIWTFKYGDKSRGLFTLVVSSFANPFYSLFYVAAMAGLGLHLSHGFQSAFQSLGANHPRYTPLIERFGLLFAAAMALGFAILPVWAYFCGGR
jgi:succinate dehydrogenase / fumarate reductase cytochrome b subunit